MTDYFSDFTIDNGDTLDDLAAGWEEFTRKPSRELVGRAFTLYTDTDDTIEYDFVDDEQVLVRFPGKEAASETYIAYEEAPGAFIVSHPVSGRDKPTHSFLILDFDAARAVVFETAIIDQTGPRGATSTTIIQAGIDTRSFTPVPEADDLIGKRAVWVYSHKHLFEHIYLNRNTFIWTCVRGAEVNQAYAEKAVYFRLRPGVYVLYWKQRKWALENIGLMNFNEWHLTLAGFAWNAATQQVYSGIDNGYGKLLNETAYDKDALVEYGRRSYNNHATA